MGKRDSRNSQKMKQRRSQNKKLDRDKRKLLAAQEAGRATVVAPKKTTGKKEKPAPAPEPSSETAPTERSSG